MRMVSNLRIRWDRKTLWPPLFSTSERERERNEPKVQETKKQETEAAIIYKEKEMTALIWKKTYLYHPSGVWQGAVEEHSSYKTHDVCANECKATSPYFKDHS